jgi:two-component sensor histidine kinase
MIPSPALACEPAALREFAVLLAPYDERGVVGDRVRVSVPGEVRVGEAAATTLALVVHELATNAVKYGSLSAARGTLDVSCADRRWCMDMLSP